MFEIVEGRPRVCCSGQTFRTHACKHAPAKQGAELNRASPKATLECVNASGATDFRPDLAKFDIPTLVIHGDSDAIVPFEASGKRAHEAVDGSELVVIEGGPHAINASRVKHFNDALLAFLGR